MVATGDIKPTELRERNAGVDLWRSLNTKMSHRRRRRQMFLLKRANVASASLVHWPKPIYTAHDEMSAFTSLIAWHCRSSFLVLIGG